MDVVGHQAVGVDRISVASTVSAESFEIGPVVGVAEKGLSSLIAPGNDVVEQSRGKHSGTAGHGADL
jgi:hypothetical protein